MRWIFRDSWLILCTSNLAMHLEPYIQSKVIWKRWHCPVKAAVSDIEIPRKKGKCSRGRALVLDVLRPVGPPVIDIDPSHPLLCSSFVSPWGLAIWHCPNVYSIFFIRHLGQKLSMCTITNIGSEPNTTKNQDCMLEIIKSQIYVLITWICIMITLIGYPSLRSEWFCLLQGNEVLSAPGTASGGYERVGWGDEHVFCISAYLTRPSVNSTLGSMILPLSSTALLMS